MVADTALYGFFSKL